MKRILLPIVPVKFVAKFLLKKFVTKFVDRPINFDLVKFDGDYVKLTDLNLNCKVLNEKIGSRINFVKVHVGELNIRFQLKEDTKVTLVIDRVTVEATTTLESKIFKKTV